MDFTGTHQDSIDLKRSFFKLRPRLTVSKDLFNAELGFNVAVETHGIGNYHLYPHAKGTYQVIKDELSVFAELTGELENNNLRNIERL